MLYHLFEFIDNNYDLPGAGLFKYISFRSGMAIILSLTISIVFGERVIRSLKRLQIGETIRDLGLEGQMSKSGTPTMGGLIIIMSILIPCLLLARLDNVYIQLLILTTVWMGFIGFTDDYIKVFRKSKDGLAGKFKIFGQVVLGLVVALTMLFNNDIVVRMDKVTASELGLETIKESSYTSRTSDGEVKHYVDVKTTMTNMPFFKNNEFNYGFLQNVFHSNAPWLVWIVFIPVIILVITAVSNSANLTDGLDGLATGISAIIGATLGILAYVSGNTILADYLNIFYIPLSEEIVVFSACFIGATVGFLWHNSYPAKVFMGDIGSLTIGGIIAVIAILIRKELLIPILCGIFLVESLSVIIQVSYFKYTKRVLGEGKRVFRMTPLHHHFQKMDMPEARIVIRFWIVGVMLAVLTLITLKIR